MAEWCMEHPYMTFWIVILALCTLDSAIKNFCNMFESVFGKEDEDGEDDEDDG